MKLERTLNNLRKFSFKGFGKPKLHFYKCPLTNSYNFDFNQFFVVKKPQQTGITYIGHPTSYTTSGELLGELTTTVPNHFLTEIDYTTTLTNGITIRPSRNGTIYSTVNSTTSTVNFDYTSLYPMWQTTTTL